MAPPAVEEESRQVINLVDAEETRDNGHVEQDRRPGHRRHCAPDAKPKGVAICGDL